MEAARAAIAGGSVSVLTGAGVSAESGVPTFRGERGLWRSFRPEDLATSDAFFEDPILVWQWYSWRRDLVSKCLPNRAHEAIAAWSMRTETPVITQNVDGLHARALGPSRVNGTHPIELHGSLFGVRCTSCGEETEDRALGLVPDVSGLTPHDLPRCDCGGLLRPGVVWFGEALDPATLERCRDIVTDRSVCVVVGTSSLVYPAAALPSLAREAGAIVIEVNTASTPLTPMSNVSLRGPASVLVPAMFGNTGEDSGS